MSMNLYANGLRTAAESRRFPGDIFYLGIFIFLNMIIICREAHSSMYCDRFDLGESELQTYVECSVVHFLFFIKLKNVRKNK